MARRRFFVDAVRRGQADFTGDQAHHLRNVLRVEAGQRYEISDNKRVYISEVAVASKQRVTFEVLEEIPAVAPPVRLHLFIALIKFDRLELIVEKATELGAERIVPVVAGRSENGLEKAGAKRVARWRKIVLEASQQSRRARLPEVSEPLRSSDAVAAASGLRLFLDEDSAAPPLLTRLPRPSERSAADIVSLLVGPEGGWTDQERNQAINAGWIPASLGPQILRTETAAIAVIAVVMSAWSAKGA